MVFITGNHEIGSNDLKYSSSHLFNMLPNSIEINTASKDLIDSGACELCYMPYELEYHRKNLVDYFANKTAPRRIIFSHNDISGIQMGKWKSTSGFSVDEINDACDLFINGHLHNGSFINKKILNLGNLTGQNFSEDAFEYTHNIAILNTEDLSIKLVENPYALNFYKIDYNINKINHIKTHAVVVATCKEDDYEEFKETICNNKNILFSRIVVDRFIDDCDDSLDDVGDFTLDTSDHLQKFRDYIINTVGNSSLLNEELDLILL